MSQQISLYIDVQNRQLVRSNSTTIPTSLPDVFQGDTLGLYLEFLNATGSNSVPYQDIDFSAAAVTVAIGTIGAQPTAGYFTVSDTAATQTTGNIAFNASAAAVQTAIQAALTTNWSAATVTGSAGGPYTVTNGSNGAETALVGSSVNLTPVSSVSIGTIQTGTSDLPQIQYVEVVQNPIALQTTWTPYPAPTATVTRLQAGSGTANEIQQITLGNNPYSGAFVVNFGSQTSNPIQWNASPAAVQTALQAMSSFGSGNCSVGGSAGAWVVTFTGTLALASQTLMTTVATGLVGPLALTGSLSLNTAAIEETIGESNFTTQTFAIRVTPSGGSAFTCLQDQITIYNDLIVGAPSIPTPGVSYYTETEADALFLTFTGDGTGLMFPGLLSIASGKTLTSDNTLTLSGTDGSTLNIGSGGTLGSGAFASAYSLPDATASVLGGVKVGTGLTATSGTLSVETQLANFEALGSPATSGYVLSSTTGGTLSWIAGGGGSLTIGTHASSYLTYSSGTLDFTHQVNDASLSLVALDSSGYLDFPGSTTVMVDGSSNYYYGASGNAYLADSSGNLYTYPGASFYDSNGNQGGTGMVLMSNGTSPTWESPRLFTSSTATSGTVNFTSDSSFLRDQTVYLDSGSTISSITVARPTGTRAGQIIIINAKSAVTSLTISGGTTLSGTDPTSLTAGQSIAYQATNGVGDYIRLY